MRTRVTSVTPQVLREGDVLELADGGRVVVEIVGERDALGRELVTLHPVEPDGTVFYQGPGWPPSTFDADAILAWVADRSYTRAGNLIDDMRADTARSLAALEGRR